MHARFTRDALKTLRDFATSLAGPLFEERCAACAAPVSGRFPRKHSIAPPLCAGCAAALRRREGGYCPACGNMTALPNAAPSLCGACIIRRDAGKPLPWGTLTFFASYEGALRELILRCKAGHDLPLALLLGHLLASLPGIQGPYDAVIPIPLHGAKLRNRGFNQALEMARPLARRLNAPLAPELLTRTVKTRTQTGLSLADRKRNVRGAFAAPKSVRGKHLLLIDDVATTGATLEEAALALKNQGALLIDVAVLARAAKQLSAAPPIIV